MARYVFTLSCPDRPGIVNRVTGALLRVDANIVESAQFGDPDTATFALRTVFDCDADEELIASTLAPVSAELSGEMRLKRADYRPRLLVMVSRYEHCLLDLLHRQQSGELDVEIRLIVSNHETCAPLAAQYGIPFEQVPVTPDTKASAERLLLDRVTELEIDLVVLARYMQVLSDEVCAALAGKAINIHHSFLPGFKGPRPYHQAHERGVKMIGATAHYVTTDLDEGPIIEQDAIRVTHALSASDMVRVGRDVERMVLARAVRYHIEDRVIQMGAKTVVFS